MQTDAPLERPVDELLEQTLRELAEQARVELPAAERARIMNRAGDLCFHAGQQDRALLYYDAAIDLFIEAAEFAASAAICEKLIRLNPRIIRAHCTLAWLAIARGLDPRQHAASMPTVKRRSGWSGRPLPSDNCAQWQRRSTTRRCSKPSRTLCSNSAMPYPPTAFSAS